MTYVCQSCFAKFEEEEASENSIGDPQCPDCGSFYLQESNDDTEDLIDEEDSLAADRDEYDPLEYGAIEP